MNSSLYAFVLPNLVLTAGILAVLVLRKPVRAQFGAKMAYALWLLPVLALAASFLPPRVVEIVESPPVFEALPSGPAYVLPPLLPKLCPPRSSSQRPPNLCSIPSPPRS